MLPGGDPWMFQRFLGCYAFGRVLLQHPQHQITSLLANDCPHSMSEFQFVEAGLPNDLLIVASSEWWVTS